MHNQDFWNEQDLILTPQDHYHYSCSQIQLFINKLRETESKSDAKIIFAKIVPYLIEIKHILKNNNEVFDGGK